jgi:hypothetical protein
MVSSLLLRVFVLISALTITLSAGAGAVCPFSPPTTAFALDLSCGAVTACPNGPLTLKLAPAPSGGIPPAPFDPGYTIQPCDTVTWSFGDGTTQSVTG